MIIDYYHNRNKKCIKHLIGSGLLSFSLVMFCCLETYGQALPAEDQNIPWLFTTALNAPGDLGDNDHRQIFYYLVPDNYHGNIYLWIEDPGCSFENDQINGFPDSKFDFKIYGGIDLSLNNNDRSPVMGILLADTVFGSENPANFIFRGIKPWEGQYIRALRANLFKVLIKGLDGDDGNKYRLYFSKSDLVREKPEDARIFYNELCFMLPEKTLAESTIKILLPTEAAGVSLANFDFEDYGNIRISSNVRDFQNIKGSENNHFKLTLLKVFNQERGNEIQVRIIRDTTRSPEDLFTSFSWLIENELGEDISFPFRIINHMK